MSEVHKEAEGFGVKKTKKKRKNQTINKKNTR